MRDGDRRGTKEHRGTEREVEREKDKGKKNREEGEIDFRNEPERGLLETMQQAPQERVPRTGSPGGWRKVAKEEAGDFCRQPGLPGSTVTLTVPWELMASDMPCPTAPSPSSQARLGEAPPTGHLWAFLSGPLQPLLFLLPSGVCRAGARLLVRAGMWQRQGFQEEISTPTCVVQRLLSAFQTPRTKATLHPAHFLSFFSPQSHSFS